MTSKKFCGKFWKICAWTAKKCRRSLFGALISRAKNLLQLPSELDIWAWIRRCGKKLAEVYARYQDSLYKQNGLDFDDLLMLTVKIFENFPKVLEKYQEKVCLYFGGRISGHQRGAIPAAVPFRDATIIFLWSAMTRKVFTSSAAGYYQHFEF